MDNTKRSSKLIKVLITGVGGNIGQNVIKCLKDSSYKAYLVGCDIDLYAPGKKDVDKFFHAPQADMPEKYFKFIKRILEITELDYILPTTEVEIEFYDANRKFFNEYGLKLLINDSFVINTFSNKYRTVNFFKKNGINYPKTYKLSEYSNELEFPILVKPEKGSGSKKIEILYDENDLNYVKKKDKDVIVQEIIGTIDEEYTVGIFSDGSKTYSIAFRRYLGCGSTKFAELIKNNEIESLAKCIAKACKLKGSINLQMRKTEQGFIPFEVNPRLSSTVYFRHFFGFKDLEWWIDMYEGNKIKYKLKYNRGIGVRTISETFFDLK